MFFPVTRLLITPQQLMMESKERGNECNFATKKVERLLFELNLFLPPKFPLVFKSSAIYSYLHIKTDADCLTLCRAMEDVGF